MRTKIEEIIRTWLSDPEYMDTDFADDVEALTKQTAIAYHLWVGSQPPGQLPNNVDLYDYWIEHEQKR